MTKAQLARAVGVRPASVTQWENGDTKNLDAGNCILICESLGIRPKWLVFGHGPKYQTTEKNIRSAITLLESLPDLEVERAINVLRSVFNELPIREVPSSLSPKSVEAKYFPSIDNEQEKGQKNGRNFKSGTS
ncbi:Putative phage repressor [Mycoavidus cysteinexigens]|uniref:Phage repressor n=2 Tax=Mycoavidus cysteinexigens TaxID=1553431 RepID=A0A2Z6ET85_9BURK|nr:Putative phage repressor [Mycoavidus cysteinexigens]